MSTQPIAHPIINCDICQSQVLAVVDTKDMHWRVHDSDSVDRRVGEIEFEKLGLLLRPFIPLPVPPSLATAVEDRARSSLDGYVVARDG